MCHADFTAHTQTNAKDGKKEARSHLKGLQNNVKGAKGTVSQ